PSIGPKRKVYVLNLSTESRPESAPTKHFVEAADGKHIRIRHFERGTDRVVLIAPGYAQHGGSRIMQTVSKLLANEGRDVVLLDLRGTGESEGRFTFGREEWLDIQAALRWARERFARIELMGFSMGAYSSLRTSVDGELKPDRLFLVSCPTRFHDVVFKGGMIRHALKSLVSPELLKKERYPFFKWTFPFKAKPSAVELASRLEVPVNFLVGADDVLVTPKMSEEVYSAVRGSKSWARFEDADHAEFIFESHTASFIAWAAPLTK
ncbi:MAG: alpha/beta fold hydrolase, partial [Bdellovibrionota bacterium]